MNLNILVTAKCFEFCKGCYSQSRIEPLDLQIETKILIEFLKYAYAQGIKKVTFCGGDPLMRKDILLLLYATKKIGYYIELDTVAHRYNLNDATLLAMLIKQFQADIKKWQAFQFAPIGSYAFKYKEDFQISDVEFQIFEEKIKHVFKNNYSKIQCKSLNDRHNSYMLVNNFGGAAISSFDIGNYQNNLIGNINNKKDWCRICDTILYTNNGAVNEQKTSIN